jgi:hypothetical protein
MNERRTWNTPTREPWNPVIHQMLRAIDHHNEAFFRDGNDWHIEKAIMLRQYVRELKDWLNEEETNLVAGMVSCSRTESWNE